MPLEYPPIRAVPLKLGTIQGIQNIVRLVVDVAKLSYDRNLPRVDVLNFEDSSRTDSCGRERDRERSHGIPANIDIREQCQICRGDVGVGIIDTTLSEKSAVRVYADSGRAC